MPIHRRDFIHLAAGFAVLEGFASSQLFAHGKSIGENRPLMDPVYDSIVCPWEPEYPRHDHQLIFPLDEDRLMLVWSEYYSLAENPIQKRGFAGVGDEVSCQITSKISTDQGRTWEGRKILQENEWHHNVKQANLVRLSDQEVIFSYVGWDSNQQRNVYLRRSLDNCETWGPQQQISEPGWYCNNADHALRLSTGRVLIPAHGPYAEKYIGGVTYKGADLHSFVFYSDDGFRTWKRSKNSMTAPGRGCHEPAIVELKSGRLMCFLRNTNKVLYRSYSDDGGETWSKPQPTKLPSPESPSLVKRIPSTGDLLLLWNNVASSSNWPRTPLTAAISQDEGRSWGMFQDIDNRIGMDAAYPSVTFVGEEMLVGYYSRSRKWKRDSNVTLKIFKIDQLYQ
ncbi:sialidase family protein [Calycomorphotria hydatis]|uniref:Sialidase n=1 Tax=Calycomorphotria hydatis TaxID=2528027 RepID=A0A517TA52_9PLAN|nr:sialidase family protein [Calycomorphotria hydatis]QDT65254.1 Sialidase precursor [Calycomorphotria hydatis]